MGALIARGILVFALLELASMSCSPEARRVRDGGAGADPGNKHLVQHEQPAPRAADTTLWPGRAEAPTDRLAQGEIPPPTVPPPAPATRLDSSRRTSPP